MFFGCLIPWLAHNITKDLLTNYDPLFVSTNSRIPNEMIYLSKNMYAMCVDDVLDVEIALVIFE